MALWPGAAELAAFTLAVLVLNATPGADFLLTVTRTLAGGVRAGNGAALGISAGCVLHLLAAAFGLATTLALWPQGLAVVQALGAAYLAWLGVGLLQQAWRAAVPSGTALQTKAGAGPRAASHGANSAWAWADFRAGLWTNLLNPKVALFILAFVPQFVPAHSPAPTLSFLLLGLWMVVQGTLFLLALVSVTAWLAMRGGHAGWARGAWPRRLLPAAGGVLFLGLAWRLAGSDRS